MSRDELVERVAVAVRTMLHLATSEERAASVRAAEAIIPIVAEACVALIEQQKAVFASDEYATPQPLGSHSERFACGQCIDAIRQTYGSTK